MKKSKVSVCVLTYNQEKYIAQCLDNILAQKGDFDLEILIGEDESSDSTRSICREYVSRYPQIVRLFERSRQDVITIDGSPTGRFNFVQTLMACNGDYIAICEGDDYWTDEMKLQLQIDVLSNDENAVASFHNVEYCDEIQNKRWLFHPNGWKVRSGTKDLCEKNFIPTAAVVFKKPDEEFRFPEWYFKFRAGDWAIHLLNSLKGDFIYLDKVMGVYRHNSGSAWGPTSRATRLHSAIVMYDILLESPEFDEYRNELLKGKRNIENELKEISQTSSILNRVKNRIKSFFGQ